MFERLKNKTKKVGGCWEWQGATKGFGYGYTTIGSRKDGSRKTITTHRAMMIAVHGEIPKGKWVLHHCDNPKCINPDHLYFGTRADNVNDRESRGRNVVPNLRHEDHPCAKLNWKKVKEIRELKGKMTHQKIAEKYGVSREAVTDIINYRRWILPAPKQDGR